MINTNSSQQCFHGAKQTEEELSTFAHVFDSGLPGRAGASARDPAVGGCVSQQSPSAEPGRHTPYPQPGEGTAGVHHTGATGPTVSVFVSQLVVKGSVR